MAGNQIVSFQLNFLLKRVFFIDASSSNEAVHLQQRLRSLSTELVTLRNRLHVQNPSTPTVTQNQNQSPPSKGTPVTSPTTNGQNVSPQVNVATIQPIVPPRTAPISAPTITTTPINISCLNITNEPRHPIQTATATTTTSPVTAGANLEDLIHLQGPLTEDAVMKCLQARFASSNFYVSIFWNGH